MLSEDRIDSLLSALSHSGRRQILDLLIASPGLTVGEVSQSFSMSRIAVMKHLQVLENADLVLSEKHGRSRHLYFNPVPIQLLHRRWTTQFSAFFADQVVDIKANAEKRARNRKDSKSA